MHHGGEEEKEKRIELNRCTLRHLRYLRIYEILQVYIIIITIIII